MWLERFLTKKGMDIMEFWPKVLERIRWKIPKASYDLYFAKTEGEWSGEVLYVFTDSQFTKECLNHRYKKIIALTVEEMTGKKAEIQIVNKESNELPLIHSKTTYEEIKTFILQQNMMINRLQKKVKELEKKVVFLETRAHHEVTFHKIMKG